MCAYEIKKGAVFVMLLCRCPPRPVCAAGGGGAQRLMCRSSHHQLHVLLTQLDERHVLFVERSFESNDFILLSCVLQRACGRAAERKNVHGLVDAALQVVLTAASPWAGYAATSRYPSVLQRYR